jgi:hypothetical protein
MSARGEKFEAQVEAAVAGVKLEADDLVRLFTEAPEDEAVVDALYKLDDVLAAVRNLVVVLIQAKEEDQVVADMMARAGKGGAPGAELVLLATRHDGDDDGPEAVL